MLFGGGGGGEVETGSKAIGQSVWETRFKSVWS